uniref:Putative secreted protein n=1 Tax=Ixodes scapularis TaxID=6945 RepID=A0A4D5RU34_IXOSC
MVSFHFSTVCYHVGSFFFFFLVFSSNLDIKASTPCGLCNVSKCHAERSPTLLPTMRFSPKRCVGRVLGRRITAGSCTCDCLRQSSFKPLVISRDERMRSGTLVSSIYFLLFSRIIPPLLAR